MSSNKSHLGLSPNRPRTRSINTDQNLLQSHSQHDGDFQVTSPSTAALDQIMSNLSQQHQHHQHHQHPPHQHQHSNSQTHSQSSSQTQILVNGGPRSHFPLLPSLPPTSSSSPPPPHSRTHSQTTIFSSSASTPTADTHAQAQHHSLNMNGVESLLNRQDSASSSIAGTPPPNMTSFGAKADPFSTTVNTGHIHGHAHTNSSPAYSSSAAGSVLANSNSSLSTLIGGSPLQHRPHTPLKSSFPSSITDSSDLGASSLSSSTSAPSSGAPFETITTGPGPSLFKSLSTKSGRKHLMNSEKHVGSLPTIHHQNGRRQEAGATFMGISMKHLSLVVLLLQNSALVLMMRYSRVSVDPDQPMYLASTAVFFAEIIKLCACLCILTYKTQSVSRTIYILRKEIFDQPQEILKMLVPSGLYALQNNLLYIALSNLEAATFQVTYQMKILSTAIFSVIMLNRRLSRQKWLSLCLLMLGVTLVQLQNVGTAKTSPVIVDTTKDDGDSEILDAAVSENVADAMNQLNEDDSGSSQNPIIGLLAVLTSCLSSGFAGCYFEKILKGSEADMWVRNLQLGISGSLFSFLAMFYDRQRIFEAGVFQGYSITTWMVVINQALGGLLVAIVVKYADNILKGFATSLSIIISGMISVYFFDFEPSLQFQLGTLVVILSTFLYGRPDAPIPGFVRRVKKRQSLPPPLKYAS